MPIDALAADVLNAQRRPAAFAWLVRDEREVPGRVHLRSAFVPAQGEPLVLPFDAGVGALGWVAALESMWLLRPLPRLMVLGIEVQEQRNRLLVDDEAERWLAEREQASLQAAHGATCSEAQWTEAAATALAYARTLGDAADELVARGLPSDAAIRLLFVVNHALASAEMATVGWCLPAVFLDGHGDAAVSRPFASERGHAEGLALGQRWAREGDERLSLATLWCASGRRAGELRKSGALPSASSEIPPDRLWSW